MLYQSEETAKVIFITITRPVIATTDDNQDSSNKS